MLFQKLHVRNFLSIKEANLDAVFRPGVHLIHGVNFDMSADGAESNGSGKSSILDSILWCLYGVLSRGSVKEDKVINRAEGKNCAVEVEFTHAGKSFRVKRFRKDEEEKGSGLRWWVDGKEQTSHGSRESQKDLESALPVSLKVFQLAIQVGQGMPDRFLDLSESAKQEVLSEIVDLTAYDLALDKVKNNLSSLVTEQAVCQATLNQTRGQIEATRATIVTGRQALAAYQAQVSCAAENDEAELSNIDAETLQAQLLSEDLLRNMLPKKEQELARLRVGLKEVESGLEAVRGPVYELRGRVKSLQAAQDKLATTPTVCPTCKRPLEVGNLMDHMLEIAREQDGLQMKVAEMEGALRLAEARRSEVQRSITTAEQSLSASRIQQQREAAKLVSLGQRRNEVSARRSNHERQLASYQAKIDAATEQETKLTASLVPQEERLAKIVLHQKHWEFWKTAIPNLRASAMEEVLSYLNDRLAYYMDIFSAGAMGVRLYQETYGKGSKIRVEMKTPAEVYDLSSGGEKRRVDLALYLSLSDLLQTTSGMCCNLLAADEICDGLSPVGVRQFLDVLKVLAQSGRCVFVMSHNSAVASQFEFDSVLVVERREGRATLRVT